MQFKKLNIGNADVLSKLQMKKITGGHDSTSLCAADTVKCYVEGETEYFCSTIENTDGSIDCCCGHDAGNKECEAA